MVLSDAIHGVWCETVDDITVLRQQGGSEVAEFVQVKATQPDQLWSISMLCQPIGGSPETSILEKSLANDRCREAHSFTIVTARDVSSELRPLRISLGEPARFKGIPGLASKLVQRFPDYKSPNGNDAAWWAARATWRVLHGIDAVRDRNLRVLWRIAETTGLVIFSDQIESVYELLLQHIIKASAADKKVHVDAGKFKRDELRLWIESRIKGVYKSGRNAGSGQLSAKLEAAGLDGTAISAAAELRRSYRAKTLEPSYLKLDKLQIWEDKVRGMLNRLRVELDTGAISDNGVNFHSRSLEALAELRRKFSENEPPSDEILQGCMYHITALCQHRFVRPDI